MFPWPASLALLAVAAVVKSTRVFYLFDSALMKMSRRN